MTRWNPAAGLLLMIVFLICGCAQPCFLSQKDYEAFRERSGLPKNWELDSSPAVLEPNPDNVGLIAPGTVNDPDRKPRYISLQECIAIALAQGQIGSQSVRFPGVTEDLVTFGGPGVGVVGSDAVRVFALNPAYIGTNIERELARFDALWTSTMSLTNTDEPVQGLSSFTNGQAANFSTAIAKPLATGGVAGITFGTAYTFLARPPTGAFSVLNPAYKPTVQFGFEQPLLRNFGVDVNQVLPASAGSTLFPGLNGRRATGEGILLARIRFDQQRADFERAINFQLLNVEAQYWNLYGAYVNLYSTEQAMRLAHKAWEIYQSRLAVGATNPGELAGLRAQYEQFRASRIQNLGSVLETERLLRILLGMPVGDGTRLVPSDAPTLTPYVPDWKSAVNDVLTLRPEILMARQDLRTKQLNLIAQRTLLKPDLRFTSTYTMVGLGTQLDGNSQYLDTTNTYRSSNAFRSLASDHFNDWSMGLTLNVPLGFRFEQGTVQQAKLALAQSYAVLKEQEMKAQNQVAKQYRLLQENYRVTEARRHEREAWAERLRVFGELIKVGKLTPGDLTMLDAERQWTAALINEYTAIVAYNTALAAFQFTKGTIQQYDNVQISEGQLPQCAVVQAKDHENERTKAMVLRERSAVFNGSRRVVGQTSGCGSGGVALSPTHEVPTLVALDAQQETGRLVPEAASVVEAIVTGSALPTTAAVVAAAPTVQPAQFTVQSRPASVTAPVPAGTPPPSPRLQLEAIPASEDRASRPLPPSQPVRLGLPVGGQ